MGIKLFLTIYFAFFLGGCSAYSMRPIYSLNNIFSAADSYREPYNAGRWLAALVNYNGKEKIELVDLRLKKLVPLPGINRQDSRPISVAVTADGQRIAFIRQRSDQTELMIYRRSLRTLQRIELSPKGIPQRLSLDGIGKVLAVQVSRNGRLDIDLVRIEI